MPLKTEADGRMFPVTDSSKTIATCLRESARSAGVTVQVGTSLLGVEKNPKNGFRLELGKEALVSIQTKKLLIAVGSDPKTRQIIQSLGHSIEPPVPSLFTFNVKDARIEGLAGSAMSGSMQADD